MPKKLEPGEYTVTISSVTHEGDIVTTTLKTDDGHELTMRSRRTKTTPYEDKILDAWEAVCETNAKCGIKGASPAEVTAYMRKHNTIAELDTVIDIADQMRALRARGLL